jgi:bifunctional DNase/RNase
MMNMLEAELWTIAQNGEGGAVHLRLVENGLIIPLFMDDTETGPILPSKSQPSGDDRPGAQDVLMYFIRESGYDLVRVELYALVEDLFRARLIFSGGKPPGGAALRLEAAPSAALALAFRAKRPVFVSQELAEEIGVSEDLILEDLGENF